MSIRKTQSNNGAFNRNALLRQVESAKRISDDSRDSRGSRGSSFLGFSSRSLESSRSLSIRYNGARDREGSQSNANRRSSEMSVPAADIPEDSKVDEESYLFDDKKSIGIEENSVFHERSGGIKSIIIRAMPRTFYFMAEVIIPLYVLLSLSLFFGYFLAKFESDGTGNAIDRLKGMGEAVTGEKSHNDKALKAVFEDYRKSNLILKEQKEKVLDAVESCFESLKSEYKNGTFTNSSITEFQLDLDPCFQTIESAMHKAFPEPTMNHIAEKHYLHTPPVFGNAPSPLTFDWTLCNTKDYLVNDWLTQALYVSIEYAKDFLIRLDVIAPESVPLKETLKMVLTGGKYTKEEIEKALKATTGHGDCEAHVVGGALYWITVMTTVGYGNRMLISNGSRIMVYTAGFLSILMFATLIGRAADVLVMIFDDIAMRFQWNSLVLGYQAVLFWFIFAWATITLYSCIFHWRVQQEFTNYCDGVDDYLDKNHDISDLFLSPDDCPTNKTRIDFFTVEDSLWYSYITTTTVGFGDYFIPHYAYDYIDMFWVPLFMLLCFVAMSVFLGKLALAIGTLMSDEAHPLSVILEEFRLMSFVNLNEVESAEVQAQKESGIVEHDSGDKEQQEGIAGDKGYAIYDPDGSDIALDVLADVADTELERKSNAISLWKRLTSRLSMVAEDSSNKE